MNQREATVGTILAVLEARGVEYVLNGETPISSVLTDTDKATIRETLFTMFREGEVTYKDDFQWKVDDDKELKKYISGLVNNWIRKAKEFNNGQAYVAKNPGSRAHVQDEQLRELKKLSAQCANNPEAMSEIAEAIAARKAEIEAAKPQAQINTDALPEHLRHLVK